MSTCGACTIVMETLTEARAPMPMCVKEPVMAHLASGVQNLMPVLQGKMAGKVVDVSRDRGCKKECFSGQMHMIRLADGSVIRVPLAEVEIDTPYYTGKVQVWCFDSPLYDVMVGSILGALNQDKLNLEQTHVGAGRLRLKELAYKGMKVPVIVKKDISRDKLRTKQMNDPTLEKICKMTSENGNCSDNGKANYIKKKGLVFREFRSFMLTMDVYILSGTKTS